MPNSDELVCRLLDLADNAEHFNHTFREAAEHILSHQSIVKDAQEATGLRKIRADRAEAEMKRMQQEQEDTNIAVAQHVLNWCRKKAYRYYDEDKGWMIGIPDIPYVVLEEIREMRSST